MKTNLEAPGLKRRQRKTGEIAYYWSAEAVSRRAKDYPSKIVRLHYDTDEERAQRCQILTAELKRWLFLKGMAGTPRFDGTLGGLIDLYQTIETSPYHAVQENTRGDYDYRLRTLKRTVGGTTVVNLTAADFTRWHRNFKKPRLDGRPEMLRKAHGMMTMVRMLLSFGKSMKWTPCRAALEVIEEMEFPIAKKRKEQVTFEQAESIIDEALKRGRLSIALGQALQFELVLRQVDVIGKWTKAEAGSNGGVIYRGNRWGGGLLWSDISDNLTISKETTKTAADVEWDLKLMPLVCKVLLVYEAVHGANLVGPMIVSELTGLPYDRFDWAKDWRPIATAAGVPSHVWNRDSRAGGLTEGWDADASEKDLQRAATHSDPAQTRRYARNALASTSRVAKARIEGRKQAKNTA